jgi:hypothetical protein
VCAVGKYSTAPDLAATFIECGSGSYV